jgi:fatty acid desaturase
MEGFIARRDICSFTEVRRLSEKSDAKGLAQLASHLLALLVSGTVVWWVSGYWWLVIPAWIVHGILLNFLFCPLHETIHRTAFTSRWLNDAVAMVCGFVIALPPAWFRYFHYEHHRQTQIEGKDPELAEAKPRTVGAFVWYVTGLQSYWWAMMKANVNHALGRVSETFVPEDGKAVVVREARLYLACYGLVLLGAIVFATWAPFTYWIVPVLLATPFLRLYLLAEHTLLPLTEDMLVNTRTMTTNPIVRWLAWQMPYHTEHHTFPSIPFHALHLAYDRIAPRHGALIPGYAAFAVAYWKSLKRT